MRAGRAAPRGGPRQDGFTLFEALVAVALMGLILSILAVVTAQWVPHWRAGFQRLQQAELARLALDRIVADLSAAEFIAPIGSQQILFYGSASTVTFVRSPVGPRPSRGPRPTGLEIIRFSTSAEEGGLVRARSPFTPETSVSVNTDDFEFSDASLLLRAPLQVSFGFAGPDRAWNDNWSSGSMLPAAVRVTVRNQASGELLSVSTATRVHINAPASCVTAKADSHCLEPSNQNEQPGGDQKPANGAVL